MMKLNPAQLLPSLALIAVFGVLVSCTSQPQADRPAARQRAVGDSRLNSTGEQQREPRVQVVRAAAQEAAAPDSAGDVDAGKETFEQCGICHNVDNDEAKMGPSLKGLFKKEKLTSGKPADLASITAVIKEGGNGMPGYEDLLEADEMKNLIAYLRTI